MKRALVVGVVFAIAVGACGGSGSGGAGSADRDNLIGTWMGHYGCPGMDKMEDTLVISAGSGATDLSLKIHTTYANPDTVTGTLTSPTEVSVPEQSMGGGMGTAKLTLKGETLEFSATGMGITCGGTDYKKA